MKSKESEELKQKVEKLHVALDKLRKRTFVFVQKLKSAAEDFYVGDRE